MKILRNLILYVGGILLAVFCGAVYLETQHPLLAIYTFVFVGVASFGAYLQLNNQ
jgi:peptidoglycan/LPS O-acetylase OafA/YrhL